MPGFTRKFSMKPNTIHNIVWLFLIFLVCSFTGCDTGAPGKPPLYQAGTYTGKADGYGGAITVSTVFSGDSITEITIDSHKESSDKRVEVAAALEQIPRAIIDGQTLKVDVFSVCPQSRLLCGQNLYLLPFCTKTVRKYFF
jgi:hypothetical protein